MFILPELMVSINFVGVPAPYALSNVVVENKSGVTTVSYDLSMQSGASIDKSQVVTTFDVAR